ncbi:MAG: cyclomaltodextrinase C-terminal domain-containing protein [Bacteroidetes bacterium]|nr:cyclomaltodextrinase C-terminal domain-containing protein [Bacteroidota bacterium]
MSVRVIVLGILSLLFRHVLAATPLPPNIYHLAPPHWFTGITSQKLEIIIHAENIDLYEVSLADYQGVLLLDKTNSGNRHIAYLHLEIEPNVQAGLLEFTAKPASRRTRYVKAFRFSYELKNPTRYETKPLNPGDIFYAVETDRFCNGNTLNDKLNRAGKKVDKANPNAYHGGDVAGILSKIPYLQKLGITALCVSPVIQISDPQPSYPSHISDHYNIDPVFGENSTLRDLGAACETAGMKLVLDIYLNHIGNRHWLYQNFDTGWFHPWDSVIQAQSRQLKSYRHPQKQNYSEQELIQKSWISETLPDVNHSNSHMDAYYRQMLLWWSLETGISGFRMKDAVRVDSLWMERASQYLKKENKNLTLIQFPENPWTADEIYLNKNTCADCLPSITANLAFTHSLVQDLLTGFQGAQLFQLISLDFLYPRPQWLLLSADKSDTQRIASSFKEDFNGWKAAMALLFTQRGIPWINYGTEILLTDTKQDFPGGWESDRSDKFSETGRSVAENEAVNWLSALIQLHNNYPVIREGQTTQFLPLNGVYVNFRHMQEQTLMVIVNRNPNITKLDLARFYGLTGGYTLAHDILSGTDYSISGSWDIKPFQIMVLELLP